MSRLVLSYLLVAHTTLMEISCHGSINYNLIPFSGSLLFCEVRFESAHEILVLIALSSNEQSGEHAQMHRLSRAIAARLLKV